jgi:hypothetical protein
MGSEKAVIVRGGDLSLNREYKSAGAVTPGQLLETDSANDVKRHATAGGAWDGIVALEDYTWGKDIDDNYADNVQVQTKQLRAGDVFNGLLADGESVTKGDKVMSNGDGDVKKFVEDSSATIDENAVVGTAEETLDLSDSSGADPASRRLLVRKN